MFPRNAAVERRVCKALVHVVGAASLARSFHVFARLPETAGMQPRRFEVPVGTAQHIVFVRDANGNLAKSLLDDKGIAGAVGHKA